MPTRYSRHHRSLRLLAFGTAVLTLGSLGVSAVNNGASAAGTQVIRTGTATGWIGGNEGPSGSIGTIAFVPGPATPPLGIGSARLTVDSTGRASLGTLQFSGTRLDAITGLSFSGYVVDGTTNQLVVAADVDYDLTDANTGFQGRLTWVSPSAAPADTWTFFDAVNTGGWFATGAPGNALCTQASLCTLGQVLSSFPDAGIRSTQGAFLMRLGGPISGGATAYVDDVRITRTGDGTTTADFEPGAVVQQPVGYGGDTVTLEAHGMRPGKPATARFDTNIPGKGRRVTICQGIANAQGVAICTGTIPVNPGIAGLHTISIRGRAVTGMLNLTTDFLVLAPPSE